MLRRQVMQVSIAHYLGDKFIQLVTRLDKRSFWVLMWCGLKCSVLEEDRASLLLTCRREGSLATLIAVQSGRLRLKILALSVVYIDVE